MPLLRDMHAVLSTEISSPAEFAVAAREWLAGTLAELIPSPHESVRAGTLRVNHEHPVFEGRTVEYSDRAWTALLDNLGGYPFAVTAELVSAAGPGLLAGMAHVIIKVHRDYYAPAWASFQFTARDEHLGWPRSAQLQARWAAFVKGQAGSADAVSGWMTDDIWPPETALQRATFNTFARIPDSRTVLRGYSWVTVVAPELTARLGGAAAMQASGAFCEVSVLPGGSLWLRATPTINDFTGDRIREVFEALAPVLVTGPANLQWPGEEYRIINGADAASHRPAPGA
jgi:hypothetical protein